MLLAGGCIKPEVPPTFPATLDLGAETFISAPHLRPPVVKDMFKLESATTGMLLFAPHFRSSSDADEWDALIEDAAAEDSAARDAEPLAARPDAGILMVTNGGETSWFLPAWDDIELRNVAVQNLGDQQVITYWRGSVVDEQTGEGEFVIVGSDMGELRTVNAANDLRASFQDLVLTARNSALLIAHPVVRLDEGDIRTTIVQEVALDTGEVLFEWNALDHVDPSESTVEKPQDDEVPWDYFHGTSVSEGTDGSVLISARNTSTVYKVDRETGTIVWRLGGKLSDFTGDDDARFSYQNDVRWRNEGRISLLDSGIPPVDRRDSDRDSDTDTDTDTESDDEDVPLPPSRGLILGIDEVERAVTVEAEFPHPLGFSGSTAGSHQVLENGNSVVAWGSHASITEFTRDGGIVRHAVFPASMATDRAILAQWAGTPFARPALNARSNTTTTRLNMSWNGSTGVTRWRILAGDDRDDLEVIETVPRTGFETEATLDRRFGFVRVQALNAIGEVLSQSDVEEAS
ncbi:hypothetical protein GCM10011410_07170 [Hoyosella rhizosphaerae]|uniref:ArsR family transcriptional regulator n=1 Tax=Hoyosella rhizosphaerae TaxID=1755582 RepID=A0A916X9J4_9ACTN|nr:hypothetical protein GCM10011410_07170 [Hoyosella rhizosphaerae]